MKLHLLGASGTGTTTLGRALAQKLGVFHADAADYYWVPTDPPFLRKRSYKERLRLLDLDLDDDAGWVVSGSMMDWGEAVADRADHLIFLTLPTDLRIARLRAREQQRFGARIAPGGDMYQAHENFIRWAEGYDDPSFGGRTRARHEAWLGERDGRVLRLDGAAPIAENLARTLARVPPILSEQKPCASVG
ncbi:hypothetical protein B5C34_03160 [Pacificimonas flava]|uniref:Adenylate kinase n=1 Tax=Pacificimonas flava TaxID=1234595 RepID=A0A219B2Z3_9SPHN|nr:hypothetical protein B5C34_03160 [Pacificimonas flava]